MLPEQFDADLYIKWHEDKFPADKPLKEKIEQFRNNLMLSSKENLNLLGKIIELQFPRCETEYETSFHIPTRYETPLLKHLMPIPESNYRVLFKSTDSIINKMWRKAYHQGKPIAFEDLVTIIHDLVRSEITSSTLDGAKFLVQRMNFKHWQYLGASVKTELEEKVESVEFESEMKMGSGYFAYHGLVKFKDGLTVELQVYSVLSQHWRQLSHLLYEKSRLSPSQKYDFGSKEAKLISLGHLLHVAECELQSLANEIYKK